MQATAAFNVSVAGDLWPVPFGCDVGHTVIPVVWGTCIGLGSLVRVRPGIPHPALRTRRHETPSRFRLRFVPST